MQVASHVLSGMESRNGTERGSEDGAVVMALTCYLCGSGNILAPSVTSGSSVIVGSRPCSEGFLSRSSVFAL